MAARAARTPAPDVAGRSSKQASSALVRREQRLDLARAASASPRRRRHEEASAPPRQLERVVEDLLDALATPRASWRQGRLEPDLAAQPGPRRPPLALDGRRRDAGDLGGFLDAGRRRTAARRRAPAARRASRAVERVVEREQLRSADPPARSARARASGTRCAALGGLAARAWSTRTRRIMCAAIPKKCARFCHSTDPGPRAAGRPRGRARSAEACARPLARRADAASRRSSP